MRIKHSRAIDLPGRSVRYREVTPGYLRLRVSHFGRQIERRCGERHEFWRAFHKHHGVGSSAFLVGANPYRQPLQSTENNARRHWLRCAIELQWKCVGATAFVPKQPENEITGFLVLGISFHDAQRLAQKFGQHWLVYTGVGFTPRLYKNVGY